MTGERDDGRSELAVLRSACDESRAVLDDQLRELSDIGDKALWTVRTAMIVLGVVVSAVSLGDATPFDGATVWLELPVLVGIGLLLASSVYGLGTYFGSSRVSGIGPDFRQRARTGQLDEAEWRLALLDGYESWAADMADETDRYGTHLFRAQVLFIAGVCLFVLSATLSIWAL